MHTSRHQCMQHTHTSPALARSTAFTSRSAPDQRCASRHAITHQATRRTRRDLRADGDGIDGQRGGVVDGERADQLHRRAQLVERARLRATSRAPAQLPRSPPAMTRTQLRCHWEPWRAHTLTNDHHRHSTLDAAHNRLCRTRMRTFPSVLSAGYSSCSKKNTCAQCGECVHARDRKNAHLITRQTKVLVFLKERHSFVIRSVTRHNQQRRVDLETTLLRCVRSRDSFTSSSGF
jgi:hypothetical protein